MILILERKTNFKLNRSRVKCFAKVILFILFFSQSAKREMNRYEKQARKMKGPNNSMKKAVGVSLNGSKLSL